MKDLDIILYGASGFTGRQAVQYFTEQAPSHLRWAIAGRHRQKLEALDAGVPIFIANPSDPASIDSFVSRARIVLSTAGPFALYSDAVVDACVRFSTHYVDITGETLWVRSLIDRYHERAAAAGTRIIPFCGFDSIPAEFGVAQVIQELGQPSQIKAYYRWNAGVPNGGTVATAFQLSAAKDKLRVQEPFLLSPEIQRSPTAFEIDPTRASYDPDIKSWVTPFIMGPINTRVMRRSFALQDMDCGYQEYAKAKDAVRAHIAASIGNLLSWSMQSPRLRSFLQQISPQPGTGPTEAVMNEGWFHTDFVAQTADGRQVRLRVSGHGDPANRITVKCVCESALTLACDGDRLPNRAGILTPSTGLGQPLWDRLIARGIRILK